LLIVGSGTDVMSLLILLLLLFFLGWCFQKCLQIRSGRIWQHCSSSRYASIDKVVLFDVPSCFQDGSSASCLLAWWVCVWYALPVQFLIH